MGDSNVQAANEVDEAIDSLLSLSESEIDWFYDWMKIRIGKKLASQNRKIQDVQDSDILEMYIEYTKQ